ncbi:MAG: uroporphyrinogen decarboxylase family protein [Armatimonadota bacterium]
MGKRAEKAQRLRLALAHRQPDRVPIGEFFWTGFMKRARAQWGADFDPYRAFDLDYLPITPNMDPHIQPFEVLREDGEDIVVKTGFGATIRRSGDKPMPHFEAFSITEPEQMADFTFEDPADPRRFFSGGDDQISGVGDTLARDIPPWDARLNGYTEDFALFGSVCEPFEYLWRIVGTENALIWMGAEPEMLEAFVERIGDFLLNFAEAQIIAGKGRLDGMYIWGDVAYVKGMLFSPTMWRRLFKPHVKALIDLFHRHNLMVVYHGCGNATEIYEDFIDIGLDAYNPLEAKSRLDVVELKKQYGNRLAFVGNIDMRVLETNDRDAIRREVEYKLQAAQGGGWVFQSDHSVTSQVDPDSYAYAIDLVRKS